jgi:hypothetical protein
VDEHPKMRELPPIKSKIIFCVWCQFLNAFLSSAPFGDTSTYAGVILRVSLFVLGKVSTARQTALLLSSEYTSDVTKYLTVYAKDSLDRLRIGWCLGIADPTMTIYHDRILSCCSTRIIYAQTVVAVICS